MATLFLSQTIRTEEDKMFSDILNTVDNSRSKSKQLFSSQSVLDKYKEVSEVISSVEINKQDIRRKNMKAIMQESFFRGASWMGQNFIA